MGSGIRAASERSNHPSAPRQWASFALALCWGVILAVGGSAPALASGGGGSNASLVISSPNPPSGPAETNVVVSGAHWNPNETVTLKLGSAGGSCASPTNFPGGNPTGTPDGTGSVQFTFTWPTSLANGAYPLCGSSSTIGTVKTSNSFNSLSQSGPTLSLPSSAASGATVSVSGANWLPAGTQVEIHWGASGSNGCATLLTTLTSGADGTLSGSIKVPSFTSNTDIVIAATSPAGTCGQQSPPPSLSKTANLTVTGTGGGTPPTPTPNGGNGGNNTPTPVIGRTPTPGAGTGTPTAPTATPKPSGTKTPTPGGGGGGGSGPCPPLPNSFCDSNSTFPWWLLCLVLLLLFLIFLILLLVLISRRNQQVVVQEEDITSQIDPNSVAPMGSLRFVRAVRVTTQVVDRSSGRVLNSRARDYDEFADSNGNTQRRPRT